MEKNLIVTECKGFEASCRCCYSQATTNGGNGAIELFLNYGLSLENSVVPVIAFTGLSIQFGAVYLMDYHFPVLVMLSECLNPIGSSETTQLEMCSWLIKFVRFGISTVDLINISNHQEATIKNKKVNNTKEEGVVLKTTNFFKPVRSISKKNSKHYCSNRGIDLNHIMRMYKAASIVDDSIVSILFPIGVLAIPGADAQCHEIREFLLNLLEKF
jgi:hypothetical protein